MSSINSNMQMLTMAMGMDTNQALLGQSIDQISSGSQLGGVGSGAAAQATVDSLGASNDVLSAASTNIQDGTSYVQTADGYLSAMTAMVTRMSELAADAQNPVANSSDVSSYQQEFQALQAQLRSMVGGTTAQIGGTSDTTGSASFDGQQLFGSSAAGGITFSTGDTPGDQVTLPDMNLQSGAFQGLITQDGSGNFTLSVTSAGVSTSLSNAIGQLGAERTTVGGAESSLSVAASTLATEQQNNEAAISGISDTDIAAQSTALATYNILLQSGAAMLAQANQNSQAVLKLIHT